MDEQLRLEAEALAATIDDPSEAVLLMALLEIATQASDVERTDDDYTPFVYPH